MIRADCRLTLLLLLAAASCGCASLKGSTKPVAKPAPSPIERKAEMIAAFEAQRDAAQLQAALNRWKEGNEAACQRALAVLVERRPNYVDARVQYGELLLAQNNVAAAEAQLQEALHQAPDRADVHHSLGVIQEAAGRETEAQTHYRRALDLAPENPLYQFAVHGTTDVATPK